MTKKVSVNKCLYIRANVDKDSFSKVDRSVEITFSTGSKVLRYDFFEGPFYEELAMDKENIRLDWMNSGKAPVLDSHNRNSVKDIIGVVESAWIDKKSKKGKAKIRFSDREDVQPILRDVETGIISNISVGYKVHAVEKTEREDEKIPTFRVIDWEPMENSLVAIPADTGAGFRKLDENYECEIINHEGEQTMKLPENKQAETRAEEIIEKVDVEQVRKEAVASERKRCSDISEACKKAGIGEDFASRMIAESKSIDETRALILDELASKTNKDTMRTVHAEVGEDKAREHRVRAASEALLYRADSRKYKISDESMDYRYISLLDLAKECLRSANVNIRHMSNSEIAQRAFHSTSDFPLILENVMNKSLREGFMTGPRTFEPFIRQRQVADFKEISSLQKGPAPQLLELVEGAEIKKGTIGEGAEKYYVKTFARKVSLTRKTIINDDLSALSSVPSDMQRKIIDLENDLFWALITTPQTMADGFALFHANHGNLGVVAGAPSIATLSEARKKARAQKDIDGLTKINVALSYLVVSETDETAGDQLITAVQGQTLSPDALANINPFRGKLQLIVEPRLTVTAGAQPFYVFSDASMMPMAEKAVLMGQEAGPQTSTYIDNDTKGVSFDILYDVAFKIVEHRGFYKQPGV